MVATAAIPVLAASATKLVMAARSTTATVNLDTGAVLVVRICTLGIPVC